ncbi:MAG: nitroreductase [Gammaproteobacteria bacterium]|nr:nitroreductase [Gammaproteobacteria bacterium]
MDALVALTTRVSQGRLQAPAPDGEALERMFQAALRAPDHGALKPWRFLVVEGEGLMRLGEAMADAAVADNPALGQDKLDKARQNPLRAPMVIVAAARVVEHPKVPAVEQLLSAGAAVQNLMLAAHAQGYAAMWRTGDLAYSRRFMDALGLAPDERIVGFIYAGTPTGPAREPLPPVLAEHVRHWPQ